MVASLVVPNIGAVNPDSACLEIGGVFFRCYCWQDEESNQIGTTCFVEQAQGQDVVLWSRKMLDAGVSNAGNVRPKIVTKAGDTFLIYFIASDGSTVHELHSSQIDMTTLHTTAEWSTPAKFIDIHGDLLMDASQVDGHTDHVLAYKQTGGSVTVTRRNAGQVWSVSPAAQPDPDTCLSVYAHDGDDICMASYEGSSTLHNIRFDAADGGNVASAILLGATRNIYKVGHCKIDATHTAFVAETYTSTDTANHRKIEYGKILNSDATIVANAQVTKWLSLLSRPWAYANSEASAVKVTIYCYVGFKSKLASPDDWSQKSGFIVDLNLRFWSNTAGSVQAVPVANINTGDAFSHYRDQNCIPHVVPVTPSFGPDMKTRNVPAVFFTRIIRENNRLLPAEPMIRGIRFHHEDPWIQYRDEFDGTDPKFFDQPFPYTQFQTAEAGKGLVISGGTPAVYDGTQIAEIGYCWWPEIMSLAGTTGGSLAEGEVYSYTAVYEWRDARGQVHQSAPAIPVSCTLGSGETPVTLSVLGG